MIRLGKPLHVLQLYSVQCDIPQKRKESVRERKKIDVWQGKYKSIVIIILQSVFPLIVESNQAITKRF